MSAILYYSNFCQHSTKLLQQFAKSTLSKNVHFICIDKRINESGKMYIILENGQKIIMPENVTKVPALLLLNDNYKVLYGESIIQHFKPMQERESRQVSFSNAGPGPTTMNTMNEPMAFSLGGGGSFGITSDSYSFLDMDTDSLSAKGNGGVRQMHNYVDMNYNDTISTPEDEVNHVKGANKLPQGLTVEQLQQQRDQELRM